MIDQLKRVFKTLCVFRRLLHGPRRAAGAVQQSAKALIVTLLTAVAASRRGGTSLSLGEGRGNREITPFAEAQGRATRRLQLAR